VTKFTGASIDPHFVTSLLPVRRGIIAGIYAQLQPGVDLAAVTDAFARAYGQDPLISHGSCEASPDLLSLRQVVGTARTHLSYQVIEQKIYLFSCLDNLLKGAASQAVENLNQNQDWPRELGLLHLEAMA
jgi:N-acetyl-gamma-glutamyl-phosphate reductase